MLHRLNIQQLSIRDQRAIIGGIVFVLLFFGFRWILVPVLDKQKNLERILEHKQTALAEMKILAQQYARISGRQFSGTGQKDFSLFSFMDTQARETGIKENVVYIRPFTRKNAGLGQDMNMVDIQLSSITLSDLMAFLSRIESQAHGVTIQSLSLTRKGRKKADALLDVLMETAIPAPGNP